MTVTGARPVSEMMQMSPSDVTKLNYKVDAFNTQLKEEQKVVSKNSLEEADFMKLLITQLKSQDPTKPMDDKQFIGQMTQFTSLKQMNSLVDSMKNLTKEFDFSKAVSMVNKEVSWKDELGQMNTGLFKALRFAKAKVLFMWATRMSNCPR